MAFHVSLWLHSRNLGAVRRLVMEFDGHYTSVRCDKNRPPVRYAVDNGHVNVLDFFLEHARRNEGKMGRNLLLKNPCTYMGGFL